MMDEKKAAFEYACNNTGDSPNGLIEIMSDAFIAGVKYQSGKSAQEDIDFGEWLSENYFPCGDYKWRKRGKKDKNGITTKQLYDIWETLTKK